MKYTQEFSVDNFPFWDGAKDTIEAVKKAKKMDELQTLIENAFYKLTPSKTSINDFVWFEKDYIFKSLKISKRCQG